MGYLYVNFNVSCWHISTAGFWLLVLKRDICVLLKCYWTFNRLLKIKQKCVNMKSLSSLCKCIHDVQARKSLWCQCNLGPESLDSFQYLRLFALQFVSVLNKMNKQTREHFTIILAHSKVVCFLFKWHWNALYKCYLTTWMQIQFRNNTILPKKTMFESLNCFETVC